MGVRVGELDPRQMERLRGELAEVLAAEYAYPPFFDYHHTRRQVRPIDRERRDEIDQFLQSANFAQLQPTDIASPELRRFIERLLLRYLQVNPALNQPRAKRRLPEMRSRAAKLAAELQRGLITHVDGAAPHFGARRRQATWASAAGRPRGEHDQLAHNTRVLEAILLRPATAGSAPLIAPSSTRVPPAGRTAGEAANGVRDRSAELADPTIPVPAQGWNPPESSSPFAGLEVGAQSAIFGASGAWTDLPTGPLPPLAEREAQAPAPPNGATREIAPELYQIYGDYLRDMQPEAFAPPPAAAQPEVPAPRSFPAVQRDSAPPAFAASAQGRSAQPASLQQEVPSPRSDALIFWQLRYQLEAYIKRAIKNYGIQVRSEDPSGVIDALRRSGFVDEADLRIAESILAITDRVTATGAASTEDYREALMLYLLYHRSHLGT